MHTIEPYWNWRNLYTAEEDPESPFYGREYSEFVFSERVYNHLIHPQWDSIGSETLFAKLLFAEYEEGYAILELIGEWNDCLYNDIRHLKRNVIDALVDSGIDKFILIGENVLNFHGSDESYYEEWFEDVDNGWIAFVNFRDHVLTEFRDLHIDQYLVMGGDLDEVDWRTLQPPALFQRIERWVQKRISLV